MRSHTQAFKDEIKQYGRQLSENIDTGSTIIDHLDGSGSNYLYSDEINSIRYYYDCDLLKTRLATLVIDSKVEIPIGTEIDCRLGIKVNNNDENLFFGIFYVNKVEEQKDKKSWLVTCYDKMIETMKDYESFYVATTDTTFTTDKNYYVYYNGKYLRYLGDRTLNPTTLGLYQSAFPMTIKDYILAICNRLNITTMNISQETGNFLKQVTSEHYVDVDNNSMGYTYRDVLNEIAGALGEFLYIEGSYLTHKSFLTTNDTINEEYFNDKNVTIGKKVGPYNVVVLSRANDSDNIHYPSTLPSNPIEFKINNNLILEQDNRSEFIQGIYNRINGLEFYVNDFATKGIMYYELGDKYNVSIDGNTYPCLMLNDDITITTGLKENIYTKEPSQSVTDYKYSSITDKAEISSRNAKILVDKANGRIDQIVEAVGDNGEVTTASIVQSINDSGSQIQLNADKIYINGVTFDNDQNMTITEGTINIEQAPGDRSLYTWYNDGTKTMEGELTPYGAFFDEIDSNDQLTYLSQYKSDGADVVGNITATNDITGHYFKSYNSNDVRTAVMGNSTSGGWMRLVDNNNAYKLDMTGQYIIFYNSNWQQMVGIDGTSGIIYGNDSSRNGKSISRILDNTYVGTGVNLNNYKQAGQYGIYGSNTNAPTTNIGVLEVAEYSPDWVVQTFTEIMSGTKWQRTFHSGNTWTNWTVIVGHKSYSVGSYLANNWQSNGTSYMLNSNGIKYLQFTIRNGTSQVVTNTLPDDMKPSGNIIVMASNLASVGYVIIETSGKITCYGNIYSSGASNLVFGAVYE